MGPHSRHCPNAPVEKTSGSASTPRQTTHKPSEPSKPWYKHTRGPKSKSASMKSFWANMTHEERTEEMKRRHAVTRAKLIGSQSAPTLPTSPAPTHDQVKSGAAPFLPGALTTESIDHWISEYQSRIHILQQFRQTVSTWQHP